ncbi:interleukin-31 receptor subunit alpha-like isoform X2 [Nerophis ophidion]|uniref:interleukin-31 receptor subunit alpha-like isoform X2 n=1 Tax=Nerophis ophidion TaxID=159077 RepID=UPI002AE07CCB|nr:interleukin-31 receptor subunit alpha-like isoform X2 [Nerophis ophidion]
MFCLPLLLIVISSTSEVQSQNMCDVVPKDLYIQVGSNIKIFCDKMCVHGKVFWTLDNKVLPKSWSTPINSSRIAVSLNNFIQPKAALQCHSVDTKELLGGTTIKTYAKPTNVSCILHYKNDSWGGVPQLFTCSWKHQAHVSKEINYTVLVSSQLHRSQFEICSSDKKTCTTQDVHLSGNITLVGNYSVTVRAKTIHWEVYSHPYQFQPYQILQINPPKLNLTALSGHILAEWTTSATSKKHHCQIKYNKVGNKEALEVLNKTLEARAKGRLSFDKVESCTHYKVSVRCALDKAPWSEWSREETLLTQLHWSDVKLHLWRKVTEPDQDGERKVYAVWTEIPSTCQGTFIYSLYLTSTKDQGNYIRHGRTLCGKSTCKIEVTKDAHWLKLKVLHNETLLAEDCVYVPAVGESLPQVANLQTWSLRGEINISWDAPAQSVSGYMIDWTHDGQQYYWKESSSTITSLSGLLNKEPYNITVTPLFGNKTGLSTQALQICSTVAGPGNVSNINVKASQKSALVSWTMKPQELCSDVAIHYIIFYGTEKGPQLNVTVDGTEQSIYLKELTPDTQYSTYVRAVALTGSSHSNVRHFNTKKFDLMIAIPLMVSAGVIIVLLLFVGPCAALRCKRILKKQVPNPGLSSVALWPSESHQKGMLLFRPFSYPSESLCEPVYMEESQPFTTPDTQLDPTAVPKEQYIDPAVITQSNKRPHDPEDTSNESPSTESAVLLSEGGSPLSPYRSQSSVESPSQSDDKECKCLPPISHQDSSTPLSVYVTVELFEQYQRMLEK